MIDFISIVILSLSLYVILALILRAIIDKRHDKSININTRGLRGWKGELTNIYHRTESTPYSALNSFSKKYKMDANDRLVDFGSGKGRVAIYMNKEYGIPVTGVELNELTYKDAIKNVDAYLKHNNVDNDVIIEKEFADNYQIKKDDNKFFFFNPFNVSIFSRVLNNIIINAETHNKEVEIILYYQTPEYRKLLKQLDSLVIDEVIYTKLSISWRERFVIYKYVPMKMID